MQIMERTPEMQAELEVIAAEEKSVEGSEAILDAAREFHWSPEGIELSRQIIMKERK